MKRLLMGVVMVGLMAGPSWAGVQGYNWNAYDAGERDGADGVYLSREQLKQRYPGKDGRSLNAYKDGLMDGEDTGGYGSRVVGEDKNGNAVREGYDEYGNAVLY